MAPLSLILIFLYWTISDSRALPLEKKICDAGQGQILGLKPGSTSFEINKNYAPKDKRDQGQFGTCQTFSSHYLIQYMVNHYYSPQGPGHRPKDSPKDLNLSLPALMGQATCGQLETTINPFILLHKLSLLSDRQMILDPKGTHYSIFFNEKTGPYVQCPEQLGRYTQEEVCQVGENFSSILEEGWRVASPVQRLQGVQEIQGVPEEEEHYEDDFDEIDKVTGELISKQPKNQQKSAEFLALKKRFQENLFLVCKRPKRTVNALYEGIFQFDSSGFELPKVTLPHFSVKVTYEEHALKGAQMEKAEEEVEEERVNGVYGAVLEPLKADPPRPSSISVTTGEGAGHAMNVVGAQESCCFKSGKVVEGTCEKLLEIENSYGEAAQWYKVGPLAKNTTFISTIELCPDPGKKCTSFIRGNSPLLYLDMAKDAKFIGRYLDKYMIKAKQGQAKLPPLETGILVEAAARPGESREYFLDLTKEFERHHLVRDQWVQPRNGVTALQAAVRAGNTELIPALVALGEKHQLSPGMMDKEKRDLWKYIQLFKDYNLQELTGLKERSKRKLSDSLRESLQVKIAAIEEDNLSMEKSLEVFHESWSNHQVTLNKNPLVVAALEELQPLLEWNMERLNKQSLAKAKSDVRSELASLRNRQMAAITSIRPKKQGVENLEALKRKIRILEELHKRLLAEILI